MNISGFIPQVDIFFFRKKFLSCAQWLLIWLYQLLANYGFTNCLHYSLQQFCTSNWSLYIHHLWFDPHFIYYMLSLWCDLSQFCFHNDMPYAKLNLPCVSTYSKIYYHVACASCTHFTTTNGPDYCFTDIVARL